MIRRKFPIALTVMSALLGLTMGSGQVRADGDDANKKGQENLDKGKKAMAARKEAFKRAAALGLKPGAAGLKATGVHLKVSGAIVSTTKKAPPRAANPGTAFVGVPSVPQSADPGGIPHYFGPFGNWAYSPLPTGPLASVTLTAGGTGYVAPAVTIDDVYLPGVSCAGVPTVSLGVVISILPDPTCAILTFTAPWVTITDTGPGTGATADAVIGAATPGGLLGGGMLKFQELDKLPGVTAGNQGLAGQYLSVATGQGWPLGCAGAACVSDYYEIGLVEYMHQFHSSLPKTRQRGYVELYPPAGPFPVGAVPLFYLNPDGTQGAAINYPNTVIQAMAVEAPQYLGPIIVAGSNRAVRFKFYNLLPVGAAGADGRRPGDLFLPVDETIMGAGVGPSYPGDVAKGIPASAPGETFTQNRHAIHLHGNNTVWISDGTPHQWITPANETTAYPQGVSVYEVPDMLPAPSSPTDGMTTYYYTNEMSARLMFYHDHAYGITRLNVYAGEAAGYVVTDQIDTDLSTGSNVSGVNLTPGLKVLPPDIFGLGIPLVIQDKTFVDPTTIASQDPTWNSGTGTRDASGRLGGLTPYVKGDLWYPHVYMTAQNIYDVGGMNAFGRWHYGPWFTPPTPVCTAPETPAGCIDVGLVPNEYYDPVNAPWEPPVRPGFPNPSMPGEAFMDTPIVNGVAYPWMEVEPRAYRFRILSAANDRMFNLQLYVAADKKSGTTAGAALPAVLCDGTTGVPVGDCTEVAMRLVTQSDNNQTANTPSGLPNDTLPIKGPNWWMIGSEGGWLAAPANIPSQPIGFNMDPTAFNVGNVNQRSLFLGPAERADVVVDFSAYAGKTLILYNDAPAAVPAGVPTYDYFTGSPNLMDVGGAPTVQPGYGPNTRTIMQIRVKTGTTTTPDSTFANLQAVWAKTATKRGVFEVTQEPIILPQAAYGSAYNNPNFPKDASQYMHIPDTEKTFQPIDKNGVLQPAVTLPLQMKGMHDEMGGVYDRGFGRMSGMLGVTNPKSLAAMLIPYNYASPPTDLVKLSDDVSGAPIGSLSDGTQIWRIFHNGVDTHPIHVHLFTAQLINRIGQDNWMVDPEPSELGWKDTFKVNPLEVTFLAMKPVIPNQLKLPFELPDSTRLIEPGLPEGATLPAPPPAGWFDPQGIGIAQIVNHYVNFGWEYVWHCHILAHEEMDMMHSLIGVAAPKAPSGFNAAWDLKNNPSVNLSWTDNSNKEAGFRLERATNATFTSGLTTINRPASAVPAPAVVTYQDKGVTIDNYYWYRLTALGATVGDTWVYPGSVGFPTMSQNTTPIPAVNTVGGAPQPILVGVAPGAVPANPTLLTTTLAAGPQVTVGWTDNATTETGFSVQRCTGAGCLSFAEIAIAPPKNNTGKTSFVDATVVPGNTYRYQVFAVNSVGPSALPALPPTDVVVPAVPAAPTSFKVTAVKANGNNYTATLTWTHPGGTNLTNFTVQRATNITFTTGLNNTNYAAGLRTTTQTITKNTTYYYRIRANNSISGSSAWTDALPYPFRTGP
jgi:FtsP/CotA-like multicopper oxidase with cupredoxin domain